MADENKTKTELVEELEALRQRVTELEALEAERAQAEEALRESEERLNLAVKGTGAGLWDWNVQTGETVFNKRWAEIIGYTLAELQPLSIQTWLDLCHPDDLKKSNALLEKHLAGKSGSYHCEARMKHKDGHWVWVLDQGKVAEWDPDGKPLRMTGTRVDVTERKKAEEQLELIQFGIDHSQIGIYQIDDDGNIHYANEQACRSLGYSCEEMLNLTIMDIDPTLNWEIWQEHRKRTRSRRDTIIETIHRRKDGTEFPVEVTINNMNFEGQAVTFSFAKDISEQKEREKEYKRLVDGMNDTAFVISFEGKFIEVNDTAVEFLGYSREELFSMGPVDIDPTRNAEDIGQLIEGMKMGETQVFETRHLTKGGEIIPVEVSSSLVTYQGEPAILSIARDITERKKAEERLKLTQFGIDHSKIGIFQVDDDGNIYYANGHACKSLGYSSEELLDLKIWDIDPNFDRESWKEHRRKTRLRGDSTMETIHRRKDGTEFPIEVTVNFMEFEDKGVSFSFVKDISERKQAEGERELLLDQIREQAQQLREVMSTVPEGVLLLDAERKVVLANPVAEGALVALADAHVGDTLTHLGDRPLAELLTSPLTRRLWHEVTAKDCTFEVVARPMGTGLDPENWVLVLRDVTREREIQQHVQQQERLATVGQLAAGIAHDFNNIMAVIVLYAQIGLRMPDLPSKLRERLEVISQQAKRATDLILQILDFGRRAVLERRPLDLVPFLKEQVKLLERTLPENIQIGFAYGRGDYTVNADLTRIQQAIMNLALNARDAMATGGELRLHLARTSVEDSKKAPLPEMEAGEWVRVAVTDTGAGIPPDVLPHIFDPFFTTKAPGKGTGLGLAQVYGIVKQHEGHVDVTTRMGEGTTFVLYLPALPVKPVQAFKSEAKIPYQGRGETILVVEDDNALREALVDTIELLNYRVLAAANGREALTVLEEHAGDPSADLAKQGVALVVSDLVMPEMGGGALLHAMRERGLTLPVVMLSGHPMEHELKSLQAQGLSGWLLKPPSMEQLAQLLARALEEETG